MDYVPWLGYLAGMLTTVAYIPQLRKVWVTQSAEDISLRMMLVLAAGLALWTLFGILRNELPIIVANGASFAMAAAIIGLKIRYG